MSTPANTELPILGAAMEMASLPKYIDWLVEKQRPLEIQDPCLPGVLDGEYKPSAAETRALLNRHGYNGRMGIHAAYSGLDLTSYDPLIKEIIAKRYRQSLEFGAELGATHMVLHSPFSWFGNAFTNHSPRSKRQYIIDAAHAILTPLMPMAEQMGCTFVFEVCYDLNVVPLLDLVRSFNSPLVRLSIDTGHAFVNQQRGGATPDQWVYEGADILEHVHVQDVDGQADRHWQIGTGNINWYAFFKALRETQANPRLILEIDEIYASAEWLIAEELAQ
jgi:sugar phosphate isomerase/epimerase